MPYKIISDQYRLFAVYEDETTLVPSNCCGTSYWNFCQKTTWESMWHHNVLQFGTVRIFPHCLMTEGWTSLPLLWPFLPGTRMYARHSLMAKTNHSMASSSCHHTRSIYCTVRNPAEEFLSLVFIYRTKKACVAGDENRRCAELAQPLRNVFPPLQLAAGKLLLRNRRVDYFQRVIIFVEKTVFHFFLTDTRKTFSLLWSNDY